MSDAERTALRVFLDLEWRTQRRGYRRAGHPFGTDRGLTLWIEFGQETTVN